YASWYLTLGQTLEEHVIALGAPVVHADRNLVLDQDVGEGVARELAALVRVEDLRIAMPSSAMASSFGGISRPSALAVLMLMTKSNLGGCAKGKSLGLVPLRIRPT